MDEPIVASSTQTRSCSTTRLESASTAVQHFKKTPLIPHPTMEREVAAVSPVGSLVLKQSNSFPSLLPSRLQKHYHIALLLSIILPSGFTRLSNSKNKHYGPGGKLLPSKSQISLPLDYTTTSNQATKAVGIAGSVETLNLTGTSISTSKSSSTTTSYQKQNSAKTTQPAKSNKYIRASSSSSTRSLANRSKSLTDKCEALEKVLSSSKRNQHYQPGLSLSREDISSPQPLKTAESLPHLPPQDMDSKSIEIVTKENDVSEIRIYSSSSALPSFPNDENLPYQGIIYESTKTLITTTSPDKSHPEIHYAATDLFPAAGAVALKPQPLALPPAPPTKTTTVPKPGEVETVGKSVVLIIDNSKKSVDTKSQRKESPLTYSQPIDTIPKVRALPQIPPAEKVKEQVYSVEENQEPLYDDVINHVDPCPPPKTELRAGSLGRKSISSLINSSTKGKEYKCLPPHQLGELPPLPPPPVPPHRSLPTQPGSGQVVSSTLPCPACPPSLPPPNLPSKNLSEFHNRPLVIQENEEDYLEESSVINGFPEATLFRSPAAAAPEEDLEQEVDNLYNDIGTPTNTSLLSSPGLVIGQHSSGAGSTMKSSTAAAFASAMKEAFLGAIKSMDFDKRSVHSSSSSSAGSSSHKQNHQSLNQPEASELIYDDTALINHSKMQNAPLPQPPPSNKSSTSSSSSSCPTLSKNLVMKQQQNQNVVDEIQDDDEEEANEPLYDDVLNLTQLEKSKELISQNQNQPNGEYHSSNSSDSGTEDLPPPLPTQGPPPLSKVATDFHFPVLPSIPLQSNTITGGSTASSEVPKSKASESSAKNDDEDSSSDKEVLDRTRSLLNELNEKLSKLNFTPEPSSSSSASSTSPGASSFSSTSSSGVDTKGELSHLAPGDFSTYISKVVISPSSESSGVEEDYNSEKNYSLSNGSDAASSSDENYKMSQVSKLVSETISLARGKFLENMKLSMLSGGNANNSNNNNNNQDSQGQSTPTGPGLLMMSSEKGNSDDSRVNNNNRNNTNIEEEEEEPIYEEIGDKPEKASRQSAPIPDIVEEDEEEDRSGSPVYADAFDAKSMFDGASRSEILSFLESIRDRLTGAESTSSSESQSSSISSKKDGKFLDLVERNDSGIGSESGSLLVSTKTGIELTKLILPASSSSSGSERSSSPPEMQIKAGGSLSPCPSRKQLCSDCNDVDLGLEEDPTVNTGVAHPPPHLVHHHHHHLSSEDVAGVSSSLVLHSHSGRGVCRSCNRKRNEKKEIIMEIYETELKYGRDLRIISEEFYKPIQIAGLLAKEQLDQIFLNVDELSQISLELTSRLKMAIHKSTNANGTVTNSNETNKQGDEDLSDVNVGKIFLQLGESMMTAFENYCTRQANAGALLSQLEKEKELLRIFLRVSQMENTVLRRMNLPAFLMVPVQRVTRYPLLLSRLVKVTPADHFSRDELQLAQEKIEQHLEHMNKTTREVASVKLWRRISIINGNSSSNNSAPVHRRSNSDLDTSNIRIRKMAMDVMDWSNFNDVSCVIDNQLGSVHFNGKAMRNIYGCLLARGKDLDLLASKMDQDLFFPPAEDVVKDVKLVLVRVKNTRFCLLRKIAPTFSSKPQKGAAQVYFKVQVVSSDIVKDNKQNILEQRFPKFQCAFNQQA
ncbi:Myosin-M heavy chain [Orchesella cincta]|uniref:Myosin-M heavy chain n=1 Tax=Orchesella cincta TaxID=48709 RepID=A0A1D2MSF5_ORCCI|nr:Myosin-M heavy chain [Orchesella cincta]